MIWFWCDTRPDVGLGHLVRCLAIAQWAKRDGVTSKFVVPERWPGLDLFLADTPFEVIVGELDDIEGAPTEVVIVDGYEVDLARLEPLAATTVVIDDLGERDPAVDLVINPNVYAPGLQYPSAGTTLLGADYALLRPEFVDVRATKPPVRDEVERVFVMIGGVDPTGETPRVLRALDAVGFTGAVDLVSARDLALDGYPFDVVVHRSIGSPALLMGSADLAICAAGGSTWELACIGVPAIQLVVADNQREIGAWLRRQNIGTVLDGPASHDVLTAAIQQMSAAAVREAHSRAARAVIDGLGARRVTSWLLAKS